jgi:uncharacterized membrane protein
MEQILNNLADPSWWFTGIFFVLIGIILTKLVINWIPNIWDRLYKYFPEQLRKFNRWNKKRILLMVKNNRQKDMMVVWLIGRYWSMALLSCLCIALIFVYFALSKDITVKDILGSNKALILLPFYGLMLSVASHKKTLAKIISAHHRWKRITKRSNKDALTRAA